MLNGKGYINNLKHNNQHNVYHVVIFKHHHKRLGHKHNHPNADSAIDNNKCFDGGIIVQTGGVDHIPDHVFSLRVRDRGVYTPRCSQHHNCHHKSYGKGI